MIHLQNLVLLQYVVVRKVNKTRWPVSPETNENRPKNPSSIIDISLVCMSYSVRKKIQIPSSTIAMDDTYTWSDMFSGTTVTTTQQMSQKKT